MSVNPESLHKNDAQLLEDFAADDALRVLTANVDGFNLFRAIGIGGQEIRHSSFISYLLCPSESHGLGDHLLRFLLSYGQNFQTKPFLAASLDWDLSDSTVVREWNHIDIFVRNQTHQLAVVIENKVWSGEHGDQLERYRKLVEYRYPKWNRAYFYLTPNGMRPSDKAYVPLSYRALVDEIETITQNLGEQIPAEQRMALRHYVQLIRRQIVGDSGLTEQCQEIYRRHKRAIDLIIANRPDHKLALREHIKKLIEQTPGLMFDNFPKNPVPWISFLPISWEGVLPKGTGSDFSPEARLLFFTVHNNENELFISLTIRPGQNDDRARLHEVIQREPDLFSRISSLEDKYVELYRVDLLLSDSYEAMSIAELIDEARHAWEDFVKTDLIKIEAAFLSANEVRSTASDACVAND